MTVKFKALNEVRASLRLETRPISRAQSCIAARKYKNASTQISFQFSKDLNLIRACERATSTNLNQSPFAIVYKSLLVVCSADAESAARVACQTARPADGLPEGFSPPRGAVAKRSLHDPAGRTCAAADLKVAAGAPCALQHSAQDAAEGRPSVFTPFVPTFPIFACPFPP